jgi:radical SAM protein with 4Fe4S-binding SPASM domain
MLYRQKFDTFIRIYDKIGYITNRSNFYDRVTDESGAIFLKALSREPQSLETIIDKMMVEFVDAEHETLKKYIIEFFSELETDGFIVSGDTVTELDSKDHRFSYSEQNPKTIRKDFSPDIRRAEKDTQSFLDEYFKDKPHLEQFQIELTSRCNERCIHCYIPHENKISDIKPELFYDVLEQCSKMGVLALTLSGGEPLLHPQFTEFLRKAKEYDFAINILSNLTLLTDEMIAEMKNNRLSSVQVSLYSMNSIEHDEITQLPGSFEKTKRAVLKLIENDIPLQISCPTMKQNKQGYVDVLRWANQHKCLAYTDYIMMARYDHTTDNLDNRLSLDEVTKVLNDIIMNDLDYQKGLLIDDFEEKVQKSRKDEPVCGVCHSSFCMVANGNIYPCAGWQDYVLGNVSETLLEKIWNDSPKVRYLRSIRKKEFPKCLVCPDRAFCAMCMVRNFNENKDIYRINEHFCKVAALNHKLVNNWRTKLRDL